VCQGQLELSLRVAGEGGRAHLGFRVRQRKNRTCAAQLPCGQQQRRLARARGAMPAVQHAGQPLQVTQGALAAATPGRLPVTVDVRGQGRRSLDSSCLGLGAVRGRQPGDHLRTHASAAAARTALSVSMTPNLNTQLETVTAPCRLHAAAHPGAGMATVSRNGHSPAMHIDQFGAGRPVRWRPASRAQIGRSVIRADQPRYVTVLWPVVMLFGGSHTARALLANAGKANRCCAVTSATTICVTGLLTD
jgi:hypothetical protein